MAALDPTSRGYDPSVFARFALEISQALTVLDGPLLLLLPGMAAVSEVRGLMENDAIWPEAERERLRVTAVSMVGGPQEDEEPPAAVIIAGLTRAADSDDNSYRDARAWLKLSRAAILINARVNELPLEMASAESAYCLVTYTVAKTDTWREDADLYQEDAGSAVLWRRFPYDWRVLLDTGNAGEWTQLAELPRRPDAKKLSELCLPTMQKRQSALDALQGDNAPMSRVPARPGGAGAGRASGRAVGESIGGADDDPSGGRLDSAGVVTLSWEDIDGGGYGPTTLYGAVALHRIRTLGGDANCDPDRDQLGLHIVLTDDPADAAAAWTPSYGKLRSGLIGCCQVIPDEGGAPGMATLEQVALKPESTAEQSAALVERAIAEAAARGQTAVLANAAAASSDSALAAAMTLREAGFRDIASGDAPPDVVAAAAAAGYGPGALFKLLGRRAALAGTRASDDADQARGELAGGSASEDDDGATEDDLDADDDNLGDDDRGGGGGGDRPAPPDDTGPGGGSAVLEEPKDAPASDAADSMPGASAEDIERLKRMFGS